MISSALPRDQFTLGQKSGLQSMSYNQALQGYVIQNTRICDFYITLFSEEEDGSYSRYDEVQKEKMYTLRSIKKLLTENGMDFVGAYSDFNFKNADDGNERIYIVAKCVKE